MLQVETGKIRSCRSRYQGRCWRLKTANFIVSDLLAVVHLWEGEGEGRDNQD